MERVVLGQVELRIPRQAEFVRVARMTACALAAQLDFTYDVVKDIELAVAEACTNAIEHGVPRAAAQAARAASDAGRSLAAEERYDEIVVRFITHPEQLAVEVIDRGQGFDPEELGADEEAVGGLGLMVIRQVMDEVHIECTAEAGTCVRMIKHRARE